MRIAYIFPTVEEAKGFILENPKARTFVSGVGMAAVAATAVWAAKAKKPHLMILCGVAGAYDPALMKGEVVEVVEEIQHLKLKIIHAQVFLKMVNLVKLEK